MQSSREPPIQVAVGVQVCEDGVDVGGAVRDFQGDMFV
jgi:hypothetical protein